MSQHSTLSQQPGSDPRPSLRARLLALVVRPTAPPMWLGIVVAALFITAETLLVHRLQKIAPENAFGALFLLGVLVVSAAWGFRLAVATSLASALVYVYFHLENGGSFIPMHAEDAMAIIIFLPVALLAKSVPGRPGCAPPSPSCAGARQKPATPRRVRWPNNRRRCAASRRWWPVASNRPRCIRRRWLNWLAGWVSTMWRCCVTNPTRHWC